MKTIKSSLVAALIMLLSAASLFANPRILSVTMDQPNPDFGDLVNITVSYCGQLFNSHQIAIAISTNPARQNPAVSATGQVFVVSAKGIDIAAMQPAALPGGGGAIGYMANPSPGGGIADCDTCIGTGDGKTFVKVYQVHIPGGFNFPGCSNNMLYLHVVMKDSNLNETEWVPPADCTYSGTSWLLC